jgi:hypothetical protein
VPRCSVCKEKTKRKETCASEAQKYGYDEVNINVLFGLQRENKRKGT